MATQQTIHTLDSPKLIFTARTAWDPSRLRGPQEEELCQGRPLADDFIEEAPAG